MIFREYLERRAAFGDEAAFGPALHISSASPLPIIRSFLERVAHPLAAALIAQLDDIARYQINRGFLTTFGRFWSAQDMQALVEPQQWQQSLATAEATLAQASPRSLLVTGEALVGKTSFLRLTAQRLSNQGWSVFEASGADLMAGQIWFGQLEGRIRQATEEITVLKKLIWYIPDLLALARSGTHQGQSASILDQILPAIGSGRLVKARAKYIAQTASRSKCVTICSAIASLSLRRARAARAAQESTQLPPSAYSITTSVDTAGFASISTAL
jgi:hypothetical protein